MICCHAVSEYHALPIRIVSSQIAFHFLLITEDITHAHQVRIINSSVGIRVGIVGGPFFQLYIFGAVHYVIFFNSSRKTIITAITNVDFSLVSTFRRDQEYAVGTAGTINGCCRSVFQYTDAFYIIVIDFVQSTGKRNSVYYNQNIITSIERTLPTYANLWRSSRMRISACHLYVHTGSKTLQCRPDVSYRCLL